MKDQNNAVSPGQFSLIWNGAYKLISLLNKDSAVWTDHLNFSN